jgi:adenosylcobinamide kinase/adenosylcobinamide-phosphate guanylyltransferase
VAAESSPLTLVTGPAASGKSAWAEHLAAASGLRVCYVATGPQLPNDEGWQQRLQRHRQRRPQHWRTLEVGLELPGSLQGLSAGELALIDSLGTWVATGLELDGSCWESHVVGLLEAIAATPTAVIAVCEECGWGVVPPTALGGRFRERLGDLSRRLMPSADAAWLVVQGRAINLLTISQAVPS